MTFRLMLGIDPGLSGAIALLADGVPSGLIDMPVAERNPKGNEVNGKVLSAHLRGVLQSHPGSYVLAIMEKVNAMPSFGGDPSERRGMGAASAFNFGEGFGVLKGVLACLGIHYVLVPPRTWKARLDLIGQEKDAARVLAIAKFPEVAEQLKRKKDIGRADALLLAHFGEITEQASRAAA